VQRTWFKTELCAMVLLCTTMQVMWGSILTWASLHTTQAHAVMLTGLSGIPILFWRVVRGNSVHLYEYLGMFIMVVAVIVMLLDPYSLRKGESKHNTYVDGIALLANIPAAIYFSIVNKMQREYITSEQTILVLSLTMASMYMVMAV